MLQLRAASSGGTASRTANDRFVKHEDQSLERTFSKFIVRLSSFLVALPRCDDGAWLLRPAAVVDELLDAAIFANVEVPGIAGRVTAFRGILHRDQLSRPIAQRQLFRALIGHRGAPVPVSMQ